FEHFRGLVLDGPLKLALKDEPEHRAGVAVRLAGLTGLVHHLHERHHRLLAVQLLDDIPRGDGLRVGLLVILGRTHAGHSHTDTNRERYQGPDHGLSPPNGNGRRLAEASPVSRGLTRRYTGRRRKLS